MLTSSLRHESNLPAFWLQYSYQQVETRINLTDLALLFSPVFIQQLNRLFIEKEAGGIGRGSS